MIPVGLIIIMLSILILLVRICASRELPTPDEGCAVHLHDCRACSHDLLVHVVKMETRIWTRNVRKNTLRLIWGIGYGSTMI